VGCAPLRWKENIPSNRPSPTRALLGWQYHERSRILSKPNFSVTSVGLIAASPKTTSHQHHLEHRHGHSQKKAKSTAGQVLLVGKDEEETLLHLPISQNPVQLLLGLIDAVSVLRIDDKDETLGARIVVPPERSDLVLPSDVLLRTDADSGKGIQLGPKKDTHPNVKLHVLVRDRFHVEADSGDGGDRLVQLKLVQNSCNTQARV
jgi:hypothetical protein